MLLPPHILHRLKGCRLLSPRKMEGLPSQGVQRSRRPGEGLEFHHYRPYMAGDDLRHLDWRLYGRGGGLCVRVQTPDAPGRVAILLDASASMGYQGSRSPCSKLSFAALVAGCLAWVASRQGDQLGLFAYGETLREESAERLTLEQFCARLDSLVSQAAGDGAGREEAFRRCGEFLGGRGTVLWLSDFWDDPGALPLQLRFLQACSCGARAIQVWDPDELSLPFQGVRRFRDPEEAGEVESQPALGREEYLRRVEGHRSFLRSLFQNEEVPFLSLGTGEDPGTALPPFLA